VVAILGSSKGGTGERVGFTLHLAAQAASRTHMPLLAGGGVAKADAASAVSKEAAVCQGDIRLSRLLHVFMLQPCSCVLAGPCSGTHTQPHRHMKPVQCCTCELGSNRRRALMMMQWNQDFTKLLLCHCP
jgi:hypothetical protein